MKKDYRMEWRIHSKTLTFLTRLETAKKAVEEALVRGVRFCVAWSGGKDSTAMTHMIKTMYPETPVLSQFDDCDWPEKSPYMERIASRYGWTIHRVEPDFSVWERARRLCGKESICAQSHPITRDSFLDVLHEKQIELGCDGVFLGLRAAESSGRRKNYQFRGNTYQLKNGEWRCCPLSDFSADDVFAYLVSNDIEINPCYFYNALCPPTEIRLSWALPTVEWRGRDLEHIRKYYPRQFQRLRDCGVQ